MPTSGVPSSAKPSEGGEAGSLQAWWHAPAGPGEVLAIAWPLMLSTGFFALTLFIDRTLLYWKSDQAAASAMAAGTSFWTMTCVPMGLIGYTSTFVAQYYGANRLDRSVQVVLQGLLLSLLLFPFFIVAGIYIPNLYRFFLHEPSMIALEAEYFRWLVPGAFGLVFSSALTGFFAGLGKMKVLLFCDGVSTVVNIVLDLILIFGAFGIPSLGVVGAALASTVAIFVKTGLLWWLMIRAWRKPERLKLEKLVTMMRVWPIPISRWIDVSLMKRLVHFGWPAGIHMLAESVSFSLIMLFVGQLGELSMAATTLALGINLIAFVPINGLGMSVSVLVGQHLTANEVPLAARSVRSGLWIGGVYALVFAVFYGLFPEIPLSLYGMGVESARFEEMRPLLRPLLFFIASYCIFDALQIVFVSAIKGAGDTLFVFVASCLIGSSVVGTGYFVGKWIDGGLYWWWFIITVWVFVMAVVFSARYFQGKWKSMRVIEPELSEVDS